MVFIAPQGMPHSVTSVGGQWGSAPITSLQRVMYAIIFDDQNGPRVFVNGVEYARPDLTSNAYVACKFGAGRTWTNQVGTLSFSSANSRVSFLDYQVYAYGVAPSVLGAMFQMNAPYSPPPMLGMGSFAGPFSDCSASGAMTHQYMGGVMPAFVNNEVLDHVAVTNGMLSEVFLGSTPANFTLLPPALGYIPAQYPTGTLSLGQYVFEPQTTGVTARVLAAWGSQFGTFVLQYAGRGRPPRTPLLACLLL